MWKLLKNDLLLRRRDENASSEPALFSSCRRLMKIMKNVMLERKVPGLCFPPPIYKNLRKKNFLMSFTALSVVSWVPRYLRFDRGHLLLVRMKAISKAPTKDRLFVLIGEVF